MIYPRTPQGAHDVGRHYDDLDEFYREIWGDHLHHGLWLTGAESPAEAVTNLLRYALSHVELTEGMTACDVGCGYGATAHFLATEKGASVTGLTISARQHAHAVRKYGGPTCRFLLRDWMANGFPDAEFDLLLAIESLAHMPDKVRFFSEAFRVLKPGGSMAVLAWLAAPQVGGFSRRFLLEAICTEGRLPSMPTQDEVSRMAKGVGFVDGDTQLLTKGVRRTWSICLGRVVHKLATDGRYRRYLIDSQSSDRRFLLTLVRIALAYRTGSMRYGLFTARRPA